ncbi:MAG: hypothetical protein J0I24_14595 [Thiomonas arsenitoxydans]|uniref:Uncharacterized protein n=1 Tax=Thiomonas arsenitoxydans (strain DSM 22701 / CIP 110005 / 3As) TaxID=426114 RepID=A0A8I1MXK4_THIA3|nr:hypothetical protein [Thiomonas arsenitoxydans]MBN8745511.1 hypothetical protein [Thiomonas arsenitoxydans]
MRSTTEHKENDMQILFGAATLLFITLGASAVLALLVGLGTAMLADAAAADDYEHDPY